jgi:sialic acid synthase SpsE
MDVAAVALGANMVEKTITRDRMTRAVEHMFSLEPDDMKKFVTVVRELEVALGSKRKHLAKQESESRTKYRRSVHLQRAVKASEPLTMELIDFRRPGFGIAPHEFERYLGMRFNRPMAAGQIVTPADLRSAA